MAEIHPLSHITDLSSPKDSAIAKRGSTSLMAGISGTGALQQCQGSCSFALNMVDIYLFPAEVSDNIMLKAN